MGIERFQRALITGSSGGLQAVKRLLGYEERNLH
jgi:hypothetical protein